MYDKNVKELPIYYKLVPSTSPINATFDKYQWFDTLAITLTVTKLIKISKNTG